MIENDVLWSKVSSYSYEAVNKSVLSIHLKHANKKFTHNEQKVLCGDFFTIE